MKIASIFPAIQGEGRHAGYAVTFIRLFTERCFPNERRCKWCDTVNQDYYRDNGYGVSDVLDKITTERVVITGGEPLSIGLGEFLYLIEMLKNAGKKIDIETNGAFLNSSTVSEYKYTVVNSILHLVDRFSISPKLKNSGVGYEYDTYFLGGINQSYGDKIDYKFVVKDESDIDEIKEFIKKSQIKKSNVWMMSMTPSTKERKQDLVNICIENEWNYSPRLHLDIFGDVKYEV